MLSDTFLIIQLIVYISAIILAWVFISKTFKKYRLQIKELKRHGTYDEWAADNRYMLFFARFFDFLAALSFAAFVFISIAEKSSANVIFLFYFLFVSKFFSIALYLLLYLKIPKKQDEIS
jgi:hypothetical protein